MTSDLYNEVYVVEEKRLTSIIQIYTVTEGPYKTPPHLMLRLFNSRVMYYMGGGILDACMYSIKYIMEYVLGKAGGHLGVGRSVEKHRP